MATDPLRGERLSRSEFRPDRLPHGGRSRDRGSKGRLLIYGHAPSRSRCRPALRLKPGRTGRRARRSTPPARTRLSSSSALSLARALTAVLRASLTGFGRSPRSPEKGSSVDGSLRPCRGRSTSARPPPPSGAPQRERQELAPGKAGRYDRGNCPGCGNAPIEAYRKADGLRFVLGVT
jgi:hypothetical protein